MNTKTTRALNGLAVMYSTPIVSLRPTSLTARICAGIDQLLKLKDDGYISMDRLKGILDGKTQAAVDLAPEIKSPEQRQHILATADKVWTSFYNSKHLDRLMHASAGPNPYADLIAAFGDKASVGTRTYDVMTAAAALDKKHGISAS